MIVGSGRLGKALNAINPSSQLIKTSVFNALNNFKENKIVVTSSYTDVENGEVESGTCLKYNISIAKEIVYKATLLKNKLFIYISTFGAKPNDCYGSYYAPQSQYHISKCIAESILLSSKLNNIYIIRIGWLLGVKNGFEQKIYQEWTENKNLSINIVQKGHASHVNDISSAIKLIGVDIKKQIINVVSTPFSNRYNLSLSLLRYKGADSKEFELIKTECTSHLLRLAKVPVNELADQDIYTHGFNDDQLGDTCPYLENI